MGCCFSSDTGAQAEKTPQEVEDVNALVLFCDSQQTPSWVPSSLSLPLAEINFLTPKGETVKFQVALWWSVIGVKAMLIGRPHVVPMVQGRRRMPCEMQLMFADNQLLDASTLDVSGVCDGAQIEMVNEQPLAFDGHASTTPVEEAIQQGDEQLVLTLLATGVDANARCTGGFNQPLLLLAVFEGSFAMVDLLLRARANPQELFSPSTGTTALHMAAAGKQNTCTVEHCKIALLLCLHGLSATAEANNTAKSTPLSLGSNHRELAGNSGNYGLMVRILEANLASENVSTV